MGRCGLVQRARTADQRRGQKAQVVTAYTAKGRFERRMEGIPVKLVNHPQPGLYGAAASFAKEFA